MPKKQKTRKVRSNYALESKDYQRLKELAAKEKRSVIQQASLFIIEKLNEREQVA